jgi:manganese/zinc/iron transport system permease protein
VSPGVHEFISLDLPAMLTGTLAVLTCALLGNFLLLKRQSLMGDAISHSVLPGLVAGFLVTGSRATLPMFIGAALAGVVTVALVGLVRRLGRLESGAAMGVVFSVLFALGVVLIERGAARGVDLDPNCVLNGDLERVFWLPPATWAELLTWGTLTQLPRELVTLAVMASLAAAFITVFFKELRVGAFDPALAAAVGMRPGVVNLMLMLVVAAAVVASFEAVGSILVVAMLVCPPAAARMWTDRLAPQVWCSAAMAIGIGLGGYAAAVHLPSLWGSEQSLSAAGMMTTVAGLVLGVAILASPRHGVLGRAVRRRAAAVSIAREDLLAHLYRASEIGAVPTTPITGSLAQRAMRRAIERGEVVVDSRGLRLTGPGRDAAAALVRAHRLWETYLVRHADMAPDHVHPTAMDLEHITDPAMTRKLAEASAGGTVDPHGRPIPPV